MNYLELLEAVQGKQQGVLPVYRSGCAGVARLAHGLLQAGKSPIIIAQKSASLIEYRSLLTLLSAQESAENAVFERPLWQAPFTVLPEYPKTFEGKNLWAQRLTALYALQHNKSSRAVLTTLDTFLLRLPPLSFFQDHELTLKKNMDMAPDLVLDQAVEWGYRRVPMASVPGDIALRGDILDLYCPGYAKPMRLEFFGDVLEDIRFFEPSSQRSLGAVHEMVFFPVTPIIINPRLQKQAQGYWQEQITEKRLPKEHLAALVRETEKGGERIFCGQYYPNASVFADWLPQNPVYLLCDDTADGATLESLKREWVDRLAEDVEVYGLYQPSSAVLCPFSEVSKQLVAAQAVSFMPLRIGVAEEIYSASLPEKELHSFQEIFPSSDAQARPWQTLVATMKSWSQIRSGKKREEAADVHVNALNYATQLLSRFPECPQLLLSFSSERSRKRFLALAEQDGVTPKLRYVPHEPGVFALVAPFRRGIALEWDGMLLLGEDVMQPKTDKKATSPKGAFQGIDRYDTLKEDDLLVHKEYGVGLFKGLHRLDLGETANDYLLLMYAGNDRLYLPVDRLTMIQRFQGGEGLAPVLDKLGGNQWAASKEKAQKAIEKIAADLVEMYALRKVVKGFQYTPINEMFREFEASFGFDETPDQARAIEDVLRDMERREPMDRLVCGDVGFGKTEVAIRAAFRAALEGLQAAVLCPTTILAEQHYQTFRSRLAGFPVNVGMLSRFVSRTKQKEVLEATAKGQIDILIGTHRLLSKDVHIPRLGLLVLDEEQRFGVRHKERLKEMRKNVDALTLTATPIPRTLQLSLSGIRELSVIETPPIDRKPVATALIARDESVLREVLERELSRSGQVFWVYNRVQGLERVVEFVQKLVPAARVGIAHGQMKEQVLEDTMHKFWHGELDVLVCTSIIESGLDFPNANTLVVDQAHMFGLGQLYQLRGRVGRSDRQAFAVFVTPDPNRLEKIAQQRLRIILDMDYLGAGFKVAMEDLRLRGAGNILGESQSGHMNRLGLELFLEMLEEAVAKIKGTKIEQYLETEISLGVPAHIPEMYMPESTERLRYYKLLTSAKNDEATHDIVFEIRDRFGKLPLEFVNFIEILSFKRYLSRIGVAKADIFVDKVKLAFTEASAPDAGRLIRFVTASQAKGIGVKLHPPCVLEIPFTEPVVKTNIEFTQKVLHTLLETSE